MNPLDIQIKRLWNRKATIRHYLLNKAWEEGRDVRVTCNGEVMTIKHADIPSGEDTGQVHKSQINGETYKLIDYTWNPDGITSQS